jgi:hypothetical protein
MNNNKNGNNTREHKRTKRNTKTGGRGREPAESQESTTLFSTGRKTKQNMRKRYAEKGEKR